MLVTKGHMVLLLWHNHTMLGCGFDNTNGNPIVVCDFAWAHQGHKGDDAWEANLRGRTGATQDECRTIAEALWCSCCVREFMDLGMHKKCAAMSSPQFGLIS